MEGRVLSPLFTTGPYVLVIVVVPPMPRHADQVPPDVVNLEGRRLDRKLDLICGRV